MSIRQTMRDRPRIATALVAVIGLALAGVGLFVLKGGGDSGTATAAAVAEAEEIEAEEIEKFEREVEQAQVTTTETTARERTTTSLQPIQTTVPPSTVPNPGDPAGDDGGSTNTVEDDSVIGGEPIGEVTTTQPAEPVVGETRIIRELTSPVDIYASPALDAEVVGALGIAIPVEVKERRDGWYRIESGEVSGWAFGAYVVPSPEPDFQSVISIDGSSLRPEYADGELVPDAYQPGKYGFGFVQPDGNRTLIFLPDGLVVYVPTNQVRPVQ